MLKHPLFWLLVCLTPVFAWLGNMQDEPDTLYRAAKDFPEILHLIDQAYVDDVNMTKLMPGAFQQALESMDPSASYLAPGIPPQPLDAQLFRLSGLTLAKRFDYIYVLAVLPDSTAHRHGLRAGMFIRRIDNRSTFGMSLYEARRQLVAKPAHTLAVVLDEDHPNVEEYTVEFTDVSPTPMIKQADEHLLWVALTHFSATFQDDLAALIRARKHAQTPLVLDFRNNGRGSDDHLRQLATLFLPKGKLGHWQGAKNQQLVITNLKQPPFPNLPLYIVCDQSTSAAAEAFAALAQDHGRAVVVGQPTLGLPHHYQFLALRNGAHLQISTQQLARKDGTLLSDKPVKPDRTLDNEAPFAEQAREAIRQHLMKKAS